MAAVDLITIGKLKIIVVDADPSVSGVAANAGSLAVLNTTGKLFSKTGATDTDWSEKIGVQTLAQILSQGNVANMDIDMDGNDVVDPTVVGSPVGHYLGFIGGAYTVITTDAEGYATPFLYLEPGAEASLGYDTTKGFQSKATETNVKDTALVNLDSPDVRMPQEVASLLLSLDANKNIKGLPIATYPSLSEVARLKGITAFGQSLIDDATAADARATLGGTTIGQNVFTAANPSAIRFFKINADNTVSLRSELQLRQDLGLNTITLDSNQTTTSATLADITELVFALEANTEYEVDGIIRCGCDGVGGLFFAATVPAATTFSINLFGISTGTTAFLTQNISVSGTAHGTAFNRLASSNGLRINGKIICGATPGNFQLQFASGIALDTSTIFTAGTSIKITKIL